MLPANSTGPLGPSDHRASDADRQKTAELLGEALAEGRLTSEEHEERLRAIFASKTVGELAEIVRDLPQPTPQPSSARMGRMSALFSKIRRGGQMTLSAAMTVRSTFGAAYLNLTHAEFPHGAVDIDATSVFGKIFITIPENARVEDDGGALFGKRSLPGSGASEPGGPIVRIHGRSIFGKITVWRHGTKVPSFPQWTWQGWQG